ncbi:alcohol dehydrogenase catalytic domain-containing protein [Erythrobacter sp.]|uniref:alcohol dehydrogenase catalytic domain-containing protein n=1 Tax=Erythrobacter sp. TaxID=1042 RepID=UPI001B2744C5|nr:alcohol dehydrogenase catalytic domain-containing protein [Erythrobacter sp.]MBO6525418.1 alcohol dehydrogenase catalytic domain-containing protein [Erythrobacter sp.]MBO6529909.1 alcohol dehydrogenase catalytic domain-containing protein [Erythrobacter sp.]
MRAAVVEAPGELKVRNLSDPAPGPYQALTRQLFGGICSATDSHLVQGKLPIPGISYPMILGHEAIGEVIAVGDKVRNIKPGDLVTRTGAPATDGCAANWGGFAELGLAYDFAAMRDDGLPEDEWQPHTINRVLPADTDPAAATMMITWRETLSYINRLGPVSGKRVLIIGSGGNGFSFLALAKALGAATIAMVGSPRWADHAQMTGANAYADYRDPGAIAGLKSVGGAEGFDSCVDAVGHTGGIEAVLPLMAAGASIGLYGIEALGERMEALEAIRARGFRVHGPGEYAEGEAHDQAVELMQSGALDAKVWFDPANPFPLERIDDALKAVANRESLKAVVQIAG